MKDDSLKDQGLEKLIAGELRAQLQAGGTDCPQAEALAGYVDQTLTRAERENLQTHLTLCARCQEQVGELTRLSEAEEPAKVFVPAPARRVAWFRWAFAAPALVGLLVGTLWYTGEFRSLLKQQVPVGLKAPPPETRPAPAELKETEVAPSLPAQQRIDEAPLGKKVRQEAVFEQATTALKPSTAESKGAGAVADAGVAAENLAVPAPGAIAPPSERARLAALPPAKARDEALRATREDQLAAPTEAPEPAPAAAPQAKREKGSEVATAVTGGAVSEERETLGFAARGVMAKKALASAPAGKWQVGRRGLIQKADARGNWVTQASGVEADLFDITFATPSVGWAVGRAGTVLRTTDGGTTWNKVTIPARADLIRVAASGELTAAVVTRDGRTFGTTDGGKSWKFSPQE